MEHPRKRSKTYHVSEPKTPLDRWCNQWNAEDWRLYGWVQKPNEPKVWQYHRDLDQMSNQSMCGEEDSALAEASSAFATSTTRDPVDDGHVCSLRCKLCRHGVLPDVCPW